MTDFEKIRQEFEKLEERKPIKISAKLKRKNIYGFDTETVEGKAVLLAASDGTYIFPNTFEEIARFLIQRRFNTALNFFWNIDYDFFGIIKHLPPELIQILYDCQGIVYDRYFIRWIPRKYFCISKGKHSSHFFDLWQFYRMSLDEAAKRYIHDSKLKIDINNVAEYMKTFSGKAELLKYCIKDAQLTQRLGELLQSKLNQLGISFDKPFSCGYISQFYFFKNRETFGFKKTEWNLYALLSYYGGRFEILKRGYFSKVYQYDINSAYPFVISELKDPTEGEWMKIKDVDYNADYGFAKIMITHYSDDLISPIPFRTDSMVIYPNFESGEIYYLSYPELQMAERMGLEFDIIDSWVFYGNGEQPFRDILELYRARLEAKKTGDKTLELVLKIIMNSLYGKFAEKRSKIKASLKPVADGKEIVINGEKFYIRESNKPGLLFCPVLASYITAKTRVMLLDACQRLRDNIIAFATDSILTTKQLDEKFLGDELGKWKLEMQGEAIVLMSGVYSIRNENETKTRFRGFPINVSFFELLEKNREREKIAIEFEKVVKLGEVVAFHNIYEIDDLNQFVVETKELSCYSDEKRDWLGQPVSFGDLLENQYESVPKTIRIGEELWKKHSYNGYKKMLYDWMRTREMEEIAWMFEKMYI